MTTKLDEIKTRWHMTGTDGFLVPGEGARGDLDWLVGEVERLTRELAEERRGRGQEMLVLNGEITALRRVRSEQKAEVERLTGLLNAPEVRNFTEGVAIEAAHQRQRWGSEHDDGKAPADWFWLVGYLAGKALAAQVTGNPDKALHHTISTAAALANWHAAILGKTNMRPGIMAPAGEVRDSADEWKCKVCGAKAGEPGCGRCDR